MLTNILELVQKNLGYPALQKIDPNTQLINESDTGEEKFSQAALPAVLTGLYRYAQSDAGAKEILESDNSTDWMDKIFYDKKEDVSETISAYTGQSQDSTVIKMNIIAKESVKIAKANLPANADIREVKKIFLNQRNHILLYLLPALKMGEYLKDDTLDDNTNKMEGPVSSLMQSIGSAFSNPVTEDEIKQQ
jgi:hypothetical protein